MPAGKYRALRGSLGPNSQGSWPPYLGEAALTPQLWYTQQIFPLDFMFGTCLNACQMGGCLYSGSKKWFKTIASKLVLGNKRQNTHSSNYCSLNQLATLLLCVAGDGSLSKGWYVPVSLQMLPCNVSSPQASLDPLWPHILQVKTWLFADLFKKSSILLLTCTL